MGALRAVPLPTTRRAARMERTHHMTDRFDILLIGLNHKTAPVEVRECLGFTANAMDDALERLHMLPSVQEALLLSTCNRVEVLVTTADHERAVKEIIDFLADSNHLAPANFTDALYIHRGDDAVRHVFRVAASLDSMVVGEPQILGQLKDAYRRATERKCSGVILNRMLHRTFFVAKRIRTETGIGDHAVSVSYAAIELGRKIFGSLEGKTVLLIGAGEMAELAVEHLIRHRAGTILVTNRTFERGVELAARFNGRALAFEEIGTGLREADIVISSTGSPDYVLRRDQVKAMRRGQRQRPLFFIDIAVPRDIDPEINRLENTYVYDIDDLKGVIEENLEDRQRAALQGERIVEEAVIRFRQWYQSLEVVPTIVALRHKLEEIVLQEGAKTMGGLGLKADARAQDAFDKMTHAVVNKILHAPTTLLKREVGHNQPALYLDAVRRLFGLDD